MGYVLAVVAVALALFLRWGLERVTGEWRAPYITLLPAVMLVAMLTGPGPGLLATVLAALAAAYWILPPAGLAVGSLPDAIGLASFVGMGIFMSVMAGLYHIARRRAGEYEKAMVLRESEEEIRRQKDLLKVTLASIGDGVIVTDPQGRVTFLNGEAERLTGWTNQDAEGQPLPSVFKIINETSRQTVENPVDKVLRLGTIVGLANHTILIARDGREVPIDDSGAPIRQVDGTVRGVVLVFRDFSEQKAAERALRTSEQRLKLFVEHVPAAVAMFDRDMRYLAVSRRWLSDYRLGEQDIVGRSHYQVFPEIPERWKEIHQRCLAGATERCEEDPFLRPDGSTDWVKWEIRPWYNGSEIGGVLFFTDVITARKQAEEALRQSEDRFRRLFDSMEEGFALCEMIWDDTGKPVDFRYLEVNPAFERSTGLSAESVKGRRVTEVIPGIESYWIETYGRVARTGHGERLANLVSALGRHFEADAYSPAPGRFAAVFRDVTERKQAEQAMAAAKQAAETAKAQAEAASKAKDHFLAVLSHELRTPLTPVVATVSMLQEDPRFDPDTRDHIEMIRRNVELEARLIDDLLDVTRIERGKVDLDRHPVDLDEIIRRALEVCERDIEARQLRFGLDTAHGPHVVSADAARLQQVFWNLIKNAIKFTPAGGRVDVRVRLDETAEDSRVASPSVAIEVADSGKGIEPELMPLLFSAFEQGDRQTTRQFGGLGLGLAISKALVEMHHGTLTARSEGKDKGATFIVRLPLASDETTRTPNVQAKTTAVQPSPSSLPLRILLVEDHADTARIMKRLLTSKGHDVKTAEDVATALKLLDEQTFDLLLSDLGLPDGSGLDIMRSLRARGSALKGIAISGYGQEQDLAQSRDAGFALHLTKPANIGQLQNAIISVIGQAAAARPSASHGLAKRDPA